MKWYQLRCMFYKKKKSKDIFIYIYGYFKFLSKFGIVLIYM